jgi:acyl dehydratase
LSTITTPSRTITEADIGQYAGFSGDFAPIHMNEEYAKESPFRTRILHGVATLAICNGLIVQSGAFDDGIAFLGCNFKLTAAVFPGDTLHVEIAETKTRLDRTGEREIVVFDIRGLNQRDEAVLQAEWTQMRPTRSQAAEGTQA